MYYHLYIIVIVTDIKFLLLSSKITHSFLGVLVKVAVSLFKDVHFGVVQVGVLIGQAIGPPKVVVHGRCTLSAELAVEDENWASVLLSRVGRKLRPQRLVAFQIPVLRMKQNKQCINISATTGTKRRW